MTTKYHSEGMTIPFTASADVSSGDVIAVGEVLGYSLTDVANGEDGTLGFGVHEVPKVSGAVIAKGERVLWDASAKAFDDNAATPASGDIIGAAAVAWEAAGAGVTTILVKLTGVPGTKTA